MENKFEIKNSVDDLKKYVDRSGKDIKYIETIFGSGVLNNEIIIDVILTYKNKMIMADTIYRCNVDGLNKDDYKKAFEEARKLRMKCIEEYELKIGKY